MPESNKSIKIKVILKLSDMDKGITKNETSKL